MFIILSASQIRALKSSETLKSLQELLKKLLRKNPTRHPKISNTEYGKEGVIDTLFILMEVYMLDFEKIRNSVQENRKLLDSCNKHDFSIKLEQMRYRCKNCGGTVDISAKIWYETGLKHGGKL